MVGITLMLCGADMVSYMRTRLRIDEVSSSMATSITGLQQLYDSDFRASNPNNLFVLSQQTAGTIDVTHIIGAPTPTGGKYLGGATVITGITNPNGTPVIAWQQRLGESTYISDFGTTVGTAPKALPDSYVVPAGSSVITVEVFSSVQPWIFSAGINAPLTNTKLRSATLFQPRAALLSQITPGDRP